MRTFVLPALLLLEAACAAARPAADPSAAATSAAAMPGTRVLVYNIHAGKDAAGTPALDRVAALVRETGADLVLLQEVDSVTTRSGGVDQLDVLARGTGLQGVFGSTLAYQGGGYGIAILSRYPVRSHRVVPLPNDPPQPRAGGSREPRGALHVVVDAPGGALHVIDTHIDASGTDRWRRQEATRLVELTDSLRALGVRVMLGGDLNSTPESAVQELVRRSGLRDAWSLCGRGDSLTFPANAPVKRIDYLYLPPGTGCTEARVLASQASDHRALLVTVSPLR